MRNQNVISLPASTNYSAEQALQSALDFDPPLSDALIVGYDADGVLFVRSSRMSRAEAVFLLEQAKEWAIKGGNV